jgi:predicted small metal-binding protein
MEYSIVIEDLSLVLYPTLPKQFVMLSLGCRDVGVDCDYVAKGETEEELWRDGTEHAVRDHGFKRKM